MPETEPAYPVLRNAPIVESIVYFRFDSPVGEDAIRRFREQITADFPRDDTTTIGDAGELRYVCTSDDRKRFVRVGGNDFAYHKLAPYGDGNDFRRELRILWEEFYNICPAVQVNQLALRAINRIEPLETVGSEIDHEDYFTTYPVIGGDSSNRLFAASMRLGMVHPDYDDIRAVVVWAAQPPKDVFSKIAFVLDIEAARFTPPQNEESTLWDSMELLRAFRNRLFFESITQKTKEMYL